MSRVKPLKALDFTVAVKSKQARLNPGFVSTLSIVFETFTLLCIIAGVRPSHGMVQQDMGKLPFFLGRTYSWMSVFKSDNCHPIYRKVSS